MPPAADAYDEFEVQTVEYQGVVGSNLLTGGADVFEGEPIVSFDPAGGLERGELAELASMRCLEVTIRPLQHTGEHNSPGEAWFQTTINARDDFASPTAIGVPPDGDNPFGDQGGDSFSTNERLAWARAKLSVMYQNVVDGGGGGGGHIGPSSDAVWNYRDDYGRGPLFDRHDELHALGTAVFRNIDLIDMQVRASWEMYWDVMEDPRDVDAVSPTYSDD